MKLEEHAAEPTPQGKRGDDIFRMTWIGCPARGMKTLAVRLHPGGAEIAKTKLAAWLKANTRPSAQPPAETGKNDHKLVLDPVD